MQRIFAIGLICLFPLPSQAQENPEPPNESFHWRAALLESFAFIGLEHGFRLAGEPETRSDLKGPFWRDYGRAIKGFGGWGDGDPFAVNYIGHPAQGAVSGFIEVQNDPKYRTAGFGSSSRYWHSRLRALAWSAAYSTQFELGPLSEASIGNVGIKPGTFGAVDLVVTPLGGFGLMVAEDALDRFAVEPFEHWSTNSVARALVRSVLNPDRSLANALRGKLPWHRDNREGVRTP